MYRQTLCAVWLVVLVLLAGCTPIVRPDVSSTLSSTAGGQVADLPEELFVAREYTYEGPESLPAGWTKLTLDNQGELPHDLILFKLDEGKTLTDVMNLLESEEGEGPPPAWVHLYGQVSAQSGMRDMFIVNLTPGNYGLISFGEAEEGPPDAAQGMVKALTVTAAPPIEVALPEADVTIDLIDYSFVVSNIAAGRQLIQVNNQGAEEHEVVIFRLHEGKTIQDIMTFLEEEEENGIPTAEEPADYIGGMMLASGMTAYFDEEFTPGHYVLICFLPSSEHEGKPHFSLGMVQEVIVQ
jgi:hypothetical protein